MSGPIPEAKLAVGAQMLNPPKPIGIDVVVGRVTIAVVTLEELERAAEQVRAMKEIRRQAGLKP